MYKLKSAIGRNIRLYRARNGMSIEALAEKADVSPESLGKIENGKVYPEPDVLDALAEVLGVRPWKLALPPEEMWPNDPDSCPGTGDMIDQMLPRTLEDTFSRLVQRKN